MSLFNKLFKKKDDDLCLVILQLNAKLMPFDRHEIEDQLCSILEEGNIGEIIGGGTIQDVTGEIEYCDIDIQLKSQNHYSELVSILNNFPLPRGSFVFFGEQEQEIGRLEGLAIYLNGTELDKDVYESCDVNYVISELIRILADANKIFSYWHGAEETALYFYGDSFHLMSELITPFIKDYPLCQKSRIVQIA